MFLGGHLPRRQTLSSVLLPHLFGDVFLEGAPEERRGGGDRAGADTRGRLWLCLGRVSLGGMSSTSVSAGEDTTPAVPLIQQEMHLTRVQPARSG